jgi:hypothetical protein
VRSARRASDKEICTKQTPLSLIELPFQCIAKDTIDRRRSGNKYTLTICDYATRYPEAIALPSTEARRIAKELVLLFSRVGIPENFLSDLGSNCTPVMLQEIY